MHADQPLTPQEVADTLRIAKNTVYELVKRGELRAIKVGNKFRFDLQDVVAYKNRGQTQPEAEQTRPGAVGAAQAMPVLSPAELGTVAATGGGRASSVSAVSPALPERTSLGSGAGFILCGQDLLLDLLAQRLESHPDGGRVIRSYLSSYNGLHALYQGTVHAATAHLWDSRSDSYNLPFLPYVLPGMSLCVIHLACRTVGYYIPQGNPKQLRGWSDFGRSDLVLVNRERGSGMRVLIDQRLQMMGALPSRVPGYQRVCTTHLAAAATVAKGGGDYAIGSEKAVRQVNGVDFIPLQQERYEMVIQKEDVERPVFRALLEIVQSPEFREELDGLGGYDTRETGRIMVD